ncbi:cytidine deaminase [Ihubacter sp. rT4E-8]|uniref:cytidine deaminase n=1 Tax=unclassified Ihubacter TaxID=2633299 RepID=UPI00137989FA
MNKEYQANKEAYGELFRAAREVLPNAYVPFSHFQVGAALLTEDGDVITGVNIENSSYGATICAERTACVKALSEGYRKFKAIAVTSSGGIAFPCGICRQFLYEFAPDLIVILGEDEDHLMQYTLKELLPEGFRL